MASIRIYHRSFTFIALFLAALLLGLILVPTGAVYAEEPPCSPINLTNTTTKSHGAPSIDGNWVAWTGQLEGSNDNNILAYDLSAHPTIPINLSNGSMSVTSAWEYKSKGIGWYGVAFPKTEATWKSSPMT